MLSHVQLFATPRTVAHQAPLSMGIFRQEYWTGLPFPPAGDIPDPGIRPSSLVSAALQVDSLPTEPLGRPYIHTTIYKICIYLKSLSRVRLFVTPWTPGSSAHGIFQARSNGVSCYFLLQGTSQPRDRTQVSRIVDKILCCLSHQGSQQIIVQ